ncbi:MAG TPA: glyoxylate/hydroxypyruvate reductase A [Casimicrobiaceae bacterium]|nr:glyoxylate/hydroxypyruvate reductase A [Casimicrobiaceae bacterium]
MSILVLASTPFVALQRDAIARLAPEERCVTDPWTADPDDVEVILAIRVDADVARRFPRVRFVAAAGLGVDMLQGLAPDIPITRPVDPRQAMRMAQYVASMVLRWHREMPRYEEQQRNRIWDRHPTAAEETFTIGVMGYGALGRATTRTLRSLGYPVRIWTRTPHAEIDVQTFAGRDGLRAFLAQTRVLVCLLPLTPETRGLLDATVFAQLPNGAYMISASRGAMLVEADLLAALDAGHLAGAALDVHAVEPLPLDSPSWRHDKIFVTPHVAAMPRPEVAARQLLDNLARARRGEPLQHVVDRERGY